jgi:hypothetical protein
MLLYCVFSQFFLIFVGRANKFSTYLCELVDLCNGVLLILDGAIVESVTMRLIVQECAHVERRQEATVVRGCVGLPAHVDAACRSAAAGVGGGRESARLLFFEGRGVGVREAIAALRPGVLPRSRPAAGRARRRRGADAEEERQLFGR